MESEKTVFFCFGSCLFNETPTFSMIFHDFPKISMFHRHLFIPAAVTCPGRPTECGEPGGSGGGDGGLPEPQLHQQPQAA